MRKFLLIVGALIVLALGGLEVIAARSLAVTEKLSAPGAGPWKHPSGGAPAPDGGEGG